MKILAYGEIIWDCFEKGRTLGGAPLNFAAHAARLGAECHLCSAVGGGDAETLRAVSEAGVRTDLIRRVSHPTGYTNITLDESGSPTYEVITDVAWDYIPIPDNLPRQWDAVYYGTLAQRSPVSAASLRNVLNRVTAREVFCDLNLRHDFFDGGSIDFCLRNATLVKVNRAERAALGTDVFARYPNLKAVSVTLDADGAELLLPDGTTLSSHRPRNKVVSAVGAGDSFCAAFLVGWLEGRPAQDCLEAGVSLSDEVVTRLGAF
jgi:fructokinase